MLISKEIAIVPVGNSCLIGFQLRRAKDMIEKIIGADFSETSSFFQWIFQDSRTTHKIFEDFIHKNRKITKDDIGIDLVNQRWPFLKATNSYFCHDGLDGDGEKRRAENISDDEKINNVIEKYNHFLNKMRNLSEKKKRIFIFSNADLGFKQFHIYEMGYVEWSYNKEHIERLCDSINLCFKNGENTFIFAANEKNIIHDLSCCSLFLLKDSSYFFYDNESWDKIFLSLNDSTADKICNIKRNKSYISKHKEEKFFYNVMSKQLFYNDNYVEKTSDAFKMNCVTSIPLWGPYIRISSGFYEATIFLNDDKISGEAMFQLTCENGKKMIVESKIDHNIVNYDHKLSIRFNVDKVLHDVETRIFVPEHFSASINSIKIERISN